MNSSRSQCSDAVKAALGEALAQAGAIAWGVAKAAPVPKSVVAEYDEWIAAGLHGEMAYLERYRDVRNDPRLLLEGARSVISCAFPYGGAGRQPEGAPIVADYALGEDYHTVIKRRLMPVAEMLGKNCGAQSRVCVDTAPLRERYFAVKAGVGFIGRNNMLIVPGAGSRVFLGEIVTTLEIEPDEECRLGCGGCGACVAACPGNALESRGMVDCRRCVSYLTIEYRGERLPDGVDYGERWYGCDTCQDVCPHNRGAGSNCLPEFMPRAELMELTRERIAGLTPAEYKKLTRGSAMERAKLAMMVRNLRQDLDGGN